MITEEARHELHDALRSTIGNAPALTLMNTLPPYDWSDVATKQDIALVRQDLTQLEERIDARFTQLEERVDARFTQFEERLMDRVSTLLSQKIEGLVFKLVFSLLGFQATFAGLVVAMLQLR